MTKVLEVSIKTKANLEYKKTFSQWQSTSKNTKYSLSLPDTEENKRFVRMLSRLISQEEFITEMNFDINDE